MRKSLIHSAYYWIIYLVSCIGIDWLFHENKIIYFLTTIFLAIGSYEISDQLIKMGDLAKELDDNLEDDYYLLNPEDR